jgi:hypothetical protein
LPEGGRRTAVTLPYFGDRFDVGVTASLVYLDPQSGVVVLEGAMTADSPQAAVGRRCDAV